MIIAKPNIARRWRTKRRTARLPPTGWTAFAVERARPAPVGVVARSSQTNARVDDGAENVGEQVAEQNEHRGEHQQPHHHRIVAIVERYRGTTAPCPAR